MALTISITRGITLVEGTPYDIDDLNQLGLPTITITGSVGSSDLAAESVNTSHVVPGDYFYAAGSLSGGVYGFTLSPAPSSHEEGLIVAFKADSQNAGAVDINPNSLGAKDLLKLGTAELQAGDIRTGQIVIARYDGTAYQMLNPSGQKVHRFAITAGTEPNYTAGFLPAIADLNELTWKPIRLKIHAANTGAASLAVDGLAPKSIKKRDNLELDAGDLKTGMIAEVVWEPTANAFIMISPTARPHAIAVVGTAHGLIVQNNAATPLTKVDVDADAIILRHVVDRAEFVLADNVNLTVDLTVSGENGLDDSSETLSTWYYVWVIADATGTVAGLLSTSSSIGGVTLPSGYAYAAMVGVVRNDASSDLVTQYQVDRRVYRNEIVIFTGKAAAAADTYESYSAAVGGSDVDLATVLPPIAKRMRGNFGVTNGDGVFIAVAADANGLAKVAVHGADSTFSMDGMNAGAAYEVPIKTAQTFWWKNGATVANTHLTVTGYDI